MGDLIAVQMVVTIMFMHLNIYLFINFIHPSIQTYISSPMKGIMNAILYMSTYLIQGL